MGPDLDEGYKTVWGTSWALAARSRHLHASLGCILAHRPCRMPGPTFGCQACDPERLPTSLGGLAVDGWDAGMD
jgi:hypothetical protein